MIIPLSQEEPVLPITLRFLFLLLLYYRTDRFLCEVPDYFVCSSCSLKFTHQHLDNLHLLLKQEHLFGIIYSEHTFVNGVIG